MPKLTPGEKIIIPEEIRRKILRLLWPAVERIHRQAMKAEKEVAQK